MAPKFKFTKEEIVEAGLEMVRKDGLEIITARSLAAYLHSSSRVIFGHFETMDDLLNAILHAAKSVYGLRIEKALEQEHVFQTVGSVYIQFAIQEPKLFQLLFMNEQKSLPTINRVLPMITEHYQIILDAIISEYDVSKEVAERIYQHMWIYCHGIATLCATKTCFFHSDEISHMVTDVFLSILRKVKSDDSN